ncbi:hypothetical protein TIFTF001_034767 [Ficus carica]|uniref:TF-B3 domain-containing protein n=1 Tax=Ficus carica TaxID=3494 RepID=A0AA88CZZ4_FICCA|nr:hypothetical protein TIFTF001_051273 [Ficus carica]GMN65703.1 hypothetical protein TIFTF001_034767 [Ficus carica]
MAAQHFEKHLTPNDKTRKLSVPMAWLDAMPEFGEGRHEVLLRAVDGVGFGWQFLCAVCNGRNKKPVLNLADWGRFVSAKSLKAGDKIIFYKEENEFRGS